MTRPKKCIENRSSPSWLLVLLPALLWTCKPNDCDVIETDVRRLEVSPVDNGGIFYKTIEPGSALPANAFALLVVVTDSVLHTTVGHGACSVYKPRRFITSYLISTLPGTATSTQPVVLTTQLYVQSYKSLPVPLADYVKNKTPLSHDNLLVVTYGALPVYGQQRWRVDVGLSDGTTLKAITPVLNLIR